MSSAAEARRDFDATAQVKGTDATDVDTTVDTASFRRSHVSTWRQFLGAEQARRKSIYSNIAIVMFNAVDVEGQTLVSGKVENVWLLGCRGGPPTAGEPAL